MQKADSIDQPEKLVPAAPTENPRDRESIDVWGFRDTQFQFNPSGVIELAGDRYAFSGHELPTLVPWMSEVLDVPLDPKVRLEPAYPPRIPEPIRSPAFLKAIGEFLVPDQISEDGEIRLRHGHGHTQDEMYAIKHTSIDRI